MVGKWLADRVASTKIGFRGGFLILYGFLYLIVGASTLASERIPELFHTLLPTWFRLALWIGTGVFAILSALIKRLQTAGFVALMIGPMLRLSSLAIGLFSTFAWQWLGGFAIILLWVATIMLVSAWPEPLKLVIVSPNGSDHG